MLSYESKYRPIISITIGDPSGIGPEIILKALLDKEIYEICKPLVIGSPEYLGKVIRKLDLSDLGINVVKTPLEGKYTYGIVDVIVSGYYDIDSIQFGKEQEVSGRMAMDAIKKSIELAMNKEIEAVTTAPINKVSIKKVGVKQEGHTEIYRDLTNSPYVLTMFDLNRMRVFHLSRHMSLRKAIDYVTKENVYSEILRINKTLEEFGMMRPSIAIAGLNPHCGEGGLFGDEEIIEIIPAIKRAKEMGINVIGPISPDTLFARGKEGEFDSILALYHDQGHIPCKTIDLESTVSMTFGLPFIRGSVDHGTAFDIAGKGIATNKSMVTAIKTTVRYVKAQKENERREENVKSGCSY